MKYTTRVALTEALNTASAYKRLLPGGRIIIYSRLTDENSRECDFKLCFQRPNPFKGPSAPEYTTRGQLYLMRDGEWREPGTSKEIRRFHSPAAAIRAAEAVNPETLS